MAVFVTGGPSYHGYRVGAPPLQRENCYKLRRQRETAGHIPSLPFPSIIIPDS